MTAPLLVFGWGNASRGDDAIGPVFIERLRALALPGVECLDDYQLQPEHALDLAGREGVLFVDASHTCRAPFEVTALQPQRDASFSSHAMSPAALLQAFVDVHGSVPPPATLLAIRGERFDLGEPMSEAAQAHLETALSWVLGFLR
jgi:hydrogenase maturation protease